MYYAERELNAEAVALLEGNRREEHNIVVNSVKRVFKKSDEGADGWCTEGEDDVYVGCVIELAILTSERHSKARQGDHQREEKRVIPLINK
jgi:hypothetical protein